MFQGENLSAMELKFFNVQWENEREAEGGNYKEKQGFLIVDNVNDQKLSLVRSGELLQEIKKCNLR